MTFTPDALPSIASAVIISSLLVYVATFRKNAPGAYHFIALMVCFAAWSSSYALVLMSETFSHKVFWFNLSQIGPDFAPIFWLFLVLEHSGSRDLLRRKWFFGLFVIPLITTTFMWTNDWHHLLRTGVILRSTANETTYLSIEHGPWYLIEVVYGYCLIAIALLKLIWFFPLSSVKNQSFGLLCSMILPVFSNFLDIIGINPLNSYGPTSIVFSLTGLILAWGLFRQHFLDITPIARNVVLEKIGDGVIVLDMQNRIVDANPAAYRLFKQDFKTPSQLIGKNIHEVISFWSERDEPFTLSDNARTQLALKIDEERHFYNVTISSLADNNQASIGWVAIFNDITDEKQTNEHLQSHLEETERLQEQLREQAFCDPLTGCFNRHYLNEMLLREASRAAREKNTIGLIMLDIDYFKQINDTYGHIHGDRVLQVVGEKLQQSVRMEDMVCRYGGEEFLIIFPGISLQAITKRAKKLCCQIAALQVPFSSDVNINITVSMGAAVYPLHGEHINQVLEYADQALYAAKNSGRNGMCVWSSPV